jgi:hypothetical protein
MVIAVTEVTGNYSLRMNGIALPLESAVAN